MPCYYCGSGPCPVCHPHGGLHYPQTQLPEFVSWVEFNKFLNEFAGFKRSIVEHGAEIDNLEMRLEKLEKKS